LGAGALGFGAGFVAGAGAGAGAGACAFAADTAKMVRAAAVVNNERRTGRAGADTIRIFIRILFLVVPGGDIRPNADPEIGCLDAK
jgi:hypothetical protein